LILFGHSVTINRSINLSIQSILSGKEGIIRRVIIAKRVNNTARAVIVPDPYLNLDTISIPRAFIKLMKLEKSSIYGTFIYNRQPSLHQFSLLGVKAICHDNKVFYQNPLINLPFNADL